MRLVLHTRVRGHFRDVFARFDRQLFEHLTPPFPPVKLLRFDGSRTGDEVHLQLGLGPSKQLWVSRITDDGCNAKECWFVDEGTTLPFFLRRWHHRHRVADGGLDAQGQPTSIIWDEITFTPAWWIGPLLWPVLYLQFSARGPLYRKFFGAPVPHPSPRA